MYLIAATVSLKEDSETIDEPKPRVTAFGLGTHRTSQSFSLMYGLAFSHAFGKPLVFPLLGFTWNPAPKWTLSLLPPVSLSLNRQVSQVVSMGVSIGLAGVEGRLANDNNFPGRKEILNAQVVRAKIGYQTTVKLHQRISFIGDIGFTTPKDFSLKENSAEFLSSTVGASPYLNVGVRYALGKF